MLPPEQPCGHVTTSSQWGKKGSQGSCPEGWVNWGRDGAWTSLACAHPAVRFPRPETDADCPSVVPSASGSLTGTLLPLLLLLELEKPEAEPGFQCGHKGFKLRSSCLHGKHFTHRAGSPALGVGLLFSAQLDTRARWSLGSKLLPRLL